MTTSSADPLPPPDGTRAPGEAAPSSWSARTEQLTLRLVSWPSVTGSSGEAAFAPLLCALLAEFPCFREHPDHLLRVPTRDREGCDSVVAFVRGRGTRTLVLAGHFDTVGVENYGGLAPLACNPAALRTALRAELATAGTAAERLAAQDLAGEAFLPGRGVLDMKSGLAAGIAALEHFARDPDRDGNLIFVTTPDEENRSRGMRSVRDALPALARRWGLDIVGAINLDSTSDLGDGSTGRSIFLGTVGKLLPFAFVVGRPAHAGYPFEGLSASLIAAEIVRQVEANVDLAESAFGETMAPPVCLSIKDLRERYDVTMPDRVWLAFNVLTQRRTPAEVLALFGAEVEAAMGRAVDRYAALAKRFPGAPSGFGRPAVLRFEELQRRVAASDAPPSATDEDDPLTVTRERVDALARLAGIEGPAVIIGFAGLHYPAVHLDADRPDDRRLASAARQAAREIEAAYGITIGIRAYFSGISDMSFIGHSGGELDLVAANTPSPTFVDRPAPGLLAFPVINIGPWGREFHQKLERVHTGYAFEVLPALLSRTIDLMLRDPAAD